MVRFLLRWAAVATAASLVSACSGGMPHTSAPSAGSGTASEAIGVVAPQALGAPVGVRSVVHLPLRNAAALEALVAAQSTQGSSQYHHFITPLQFAQQYAPTAANLKAAAAALQGMGFKEGDYPVSEQLSKESLALPIFAEATEDEIRAVAELISGF